jgi:DNA-binding MarR family transcriptional regulator
MAFFPAMRNIGNSRGRRRIMTSSRTSTELPQIPRCDAGSPADWQDILDAHLDTLPDSDLAQELKADCRARIRSRLQVGDDPPLKLLSADEILLTDWPEPVWAVPGILPAGLTILAGKPKVGKSWLALQIGHGVASGGMVLGQRVDKGRVLYLALEDPPRRLRQRMQKQYWSPGLDAEFMPIGDFASQLGDLRNGGGERLALQIKLRGYRLVVIDTLSRSIYGDQNDVAQMTPALAPIQEMALEHNCAVLMNDHHSKVGGNDLIRDILGSTAKAAVVDTAWGLYREQGKNGAKLCVVGRDVAEKTLEMTFDGLTGCWQLQGETGDLKMTERRAEILEALASLGPSQVDPIADAIEQDRGNTFTRLQDLANADYVRRIEAGDNVLYKLTDKGHEYLASRDGGRG